MNKYKIKVTKSNHQEVQQLFIDLGYKGALGNDEVISHPFINLGVKPMPEVGFIMVDTDGSMIIADTTSNFRFDDFEAQVISVENLKSFVENKKYKKGISFRYSDTNQYNVVVNRFRPEDHPKRDLSFSVLCGGGHES